MLDDECGGDLVDTEAAKQVQDERNLRFLREPRIAAREHHPQQVVLERVRRELFVERRNERPFRFEQPSQLGCERARGAFPPQDIQRPISRDRQEPARGILRHAAELPDLHRAAERVLDDVFGERQVVHAEDARQGRDEPAGLPSKE